MASVQKKPASVIEGVICFFSVWSILGLAGFHTYLTTSNQTTNEDVSHPNTAQMQKKANYRLPKRAEKKRRKGAIIIDAKTDILEYLNK